MNRMLRIAASAALPLGLSACNMVVSEQPWFAEAEAQPLPVLRDGLWLSAEPDCRVNASKPAERWPDCADANFVRGAEHWSMEWDDTDQRGRRRRTFAGWELADPWAGGLLVANGDHLILQFQPQSDPGQVESRDGGQAAAEAVPKAYMYAAMRPTERDAEGKVTALESWLVQCGPLPQPHRGREQALTEGNVTDRPFVGLTVVEDNCVADSAAAVRNAAVLSEALQAPRQMRWIREGWH